ncbi:MAG: deoxyribose-phosphate aldolase [Actinomycetia bacterium]|nr:deoxyribose-phosphate aldolase [Actinomycetes bacterium]
MSSSPVTPVDAVGLEQRAASLTGRSIKRDTKRAALDLSLRCTDLTTLEGTDTPDKVASLCAKAKRPSPGDPSVPAVAAVCVYPEMVPPAVAALAGTPIGIASVAGAFPAGLGPLSTRLDEIRWVAEAGATEVDIVLNRSLFLSGRLAEAGDEIAAAKEACGSAHLKVILETGELGSYDAVRSASMLAMDHGADFIKTSTGKIGTAATPPVALCMAEAIREHANTSGQQVGLKLAGGIRTAKQAWQYLALIAETLGPEWCEPELFRFGASSLLNDLLMQRAKLDTGRYQRSDDFTEA